MSNRTQEYSYDIPCVDGSPGCYGTVTRTVKGLPELDDEQLLEIRDARTVTLTAAYVEANDVPLTPAQEQELIEDGSVSIAAYFNVDHGSCEACGSDG